MLQILSHCFICASQHSFFWVLLLCSVCSPLFVFVRIQACQLLLQQQQQQPQQQQQQLLQNQRKFTPNLRQQADPQQVPINRMNPLSFVIYILLYLITLFLSHALSWPGSWQC